MSGGLTVQQVARLRRFGLEELAQSRTGRTWLERMRVHAPELVRLYSGRPVVRERSERALARAAALVESHEGVVSDEVVQAFEEMLDALDLGASPDLHKLTKAARRELHGARGKTIRDAFGVARR